MNNKNNDEDDGDVAVASHIESIIVPPGTHYCWVTRDIVDSKLAEGFNT